jgi:hypothetical protein
VLYAVCPLKNETEAPDSWQGGLDLRLRGLAKRFASLFITLVLLFTKAELRTQTFSARPWSAMDLRLQSDVVLF